MSWDHQLDGIWPILTLSALAVAVVVHLMRGCSYAWANARERPVLTRPRVFMYLRDRGEANSKGASKNKRPSGNKISTGGGAARMPPGTEEVAGA